MATFSPRPRCLNNPNVFWYIFGKYMLKSNTKGISKFVNCSYLAYFKVMLSDKDEAWAPHIVCKQCVEHLRLEQKMIESHSALVFQLSGVNRKTISIIAIFAQSTRRKSTGRTGIRWFIQTSSLQLGQFHTAMKFLFQYLKAYPKWNCLVLKKTKPPFCPLTVVNPLFHMSVFLLLYNHSFFFKENLIILLDISNFPKNLLNF